MKLLIAGGAIWKVGEIFEQMVELAGGRGSRIGVIPLASGSPYETWNKYRKLFEIYGAKPIIIDITEKHPVQSIMVLLWMKWKKKSIKVLSF